MGAALKARGVVAHLTRRKEKYREEFVVGSGDDGGGDGVKLRK